jgi:hypothetical protein
MTTFVARARLAISAIASVRKACDSLARQAESKGVELLRASDAVEQIPSTPAKTRAWRQV